MTFRSALSAASNPLPRAPRLDVLGGGQAHWMEVHLCKSSRTKNRPERVKYLQKCNAVEMPTATPSWIWPLVAQPKPKEHVGVRVSRGDGKEVDVRTGRVRPPGLVSIRSPKNVVRKLPPGQGAGALRALVLGDPDDVPLARLADYWTVALHAVPPR